MTISKPKTIKVSTPLTKYVTGGKRSRTTKIAWHYTGASGVSGKSTVYNWFLPIAKGQHPKNYASAHFVTDLNGDIYEMIPLNYIAYTTNSANAYSIGIECATTGSDDHYTDEEYVSMVKLGAWLAQYYNLDPREDFIRHYDVTKKICPRFFVNHSDKWKQFKLDCYNYMKGKLKEKDIKNCTNGKGNSTVTNEVPKEEAFKQYIAKPTVDGLNCRKGPGVDYPIDAIIDTDIAITIVDEVPSEDGGTWCKAKSGYYVNKKYLKFVRYV